MHNANAQLSEFVLPPEQPSPNDKPNAAISAKPAATSAKPVKHKPEVRSNQPHNQLQLVDSLDVVKTLLQHFAAGTANPATGQQPQLSSASYVAKKKQKRKPKPVYEATDDDLGDHAQPDDKDAPKVNIYKPREKPTTEATFDDCGDDVSNIELPPSDEDKPGPVQAESERASRHAAYFEPGFDQ